MIGLEREYIKTMDHFGVENQIEKQIEEDGEFLEAIELIENGKCSVEDLEKELADKINLGMQFVIKHGGTAESVLNHCTDKMVRTIDRIGEKFYEKD